MNKIRVIGPREYPPNKIPSKDMYNGVLHTIINTTSRGKHKDLSPFFLGPVNLYDGQISVNIENAWQYSKVYPEHFDKDRNEILPEYFIWTKEGWKQKRAIRYPMGKDKKPLFSYWDGQRLGYIEARKQIYTPLYAREVVHTPSYNHLVRLVQSGRHISLWDFDGYDYQSLGMTLNAVLNCETRKMGHAFVIAILLNGLEST